MKNLRRCSLIRFNRTPTAPGVDPLGCAQDLEGVDAWDGAHAADGLFALDVGDEGGAMQRLGDARGDAINDGWGLKCANSALGALDLRERLPREPELRAWGIETLDRLRTPRPGDA